MCGIAGIMTINGSAPARSSLNSLRAALSHRGPDGEGVHLAGDVGLIQTRLAIIDLKTGDQPFYEPGGGALVANGEIYNYVELRAEMDASAFSTASDCEPPLVLFRRDGLDFTQSLRGMYAIAIHDQGAGRLVLARDPFGIKPLYYAETKLGFVFASEPSALISAGLVTPKIRSAAIEELLQIQFVTGRGTAFDGIFRVLPGETLVIAGGRIIERRLQQALPDEAPEDWSDAEAMERLDAILTDSVMVHQRADVPYGMFLSGGVDSSALLALMTKLNDRPVQAFTVGFAGGSVPDEREHARVVAHALGAEHIEVEFSQTDFWQFLPRIAAIMDDPAADYAVLPTFKLAGVAAQDLKVILSGEGGDELFAGYGRYRSVMRPWWRGGRAMRWRGAMEGTGILRDDSSHWRDETAARESLETQGGRTRLQVAQAVDCADWLPNDLLIKLDRCLMAHGVEGRTPLLDAKVAAFAFRLPDRLKVRGRIGKWLLRNWLAENLPVAKPFSRKRGFTVPVGDWISTEGARIGNLVATQPGIVELCNSSTVESVFRSTGKRAAFASWVLLFYALWHSCHILGSKCDGDAFDALDAAR